MKLRDNEISRLSNVILSQLFLELKNGASVLETLVSTIYATEKFKIALTELDLIIDKELVSTIEMEVKTGAKEDINESFLNQIKNLLSEGE